MDQEQATEIRFFDASSRIGRVRYLAYGMGNFLLVLPALVLAAIFFALKLPILAGLLCVLAYIFIIIMGIVFGVRRLHDLGWSGWWMLISGASIVLGLLSLTSVLQGAVLALLNLCALIFYLVLLFKPGTPGDNGFGPPPPPNSTWVIVGAWSFLLVPFFGGILAAIAIPAYQDYVARAQTSEGIKLAGGAEIGVSEYFQKNKAWPTDLAAVYSVAGDNPAGRYVATVTGAGNGEIYGVTSSMNTEGVNRMIAGKSLEIWTSDGGNTWQCGPGGPDPVDPKYLPMSCRDHGAP